MNKLLLTCFLALLCLVGRYLVAQSKVVRSPGAELLHRSDSPNREGAILPDTFIEYTNGAEISSSPLPSSGPWTVDSGPRNETATSLSGAHYPNGSQARSDDNLPRSSEIRNPKSEIVLPTSGLSLVDNTTSQGQEEGNTPARVENGMLYLELASPVPSDSLYLRFWDQLVSERRTVTPGVSLVIPGEDGNFFEGSRNFRVFITQFPNAETHGFFSIGKGQNTLAKHWYYFQGDRVRIRAYLQAGTLLFGGPEAEFYKTQYELDRVFLEEKFNADPILISGNMESIFQDSLSAALWKKAQSRPDDLYVKMKVITTAEEAWKEFETYIANSYIDHPAWKLLSAQSLSDEQTSVLESRIKGEILYSAMNKSELAMELILRDPKKFQLVADWVAEMKLEKMSYSHPLLAQGTYQWAMMKAFASNQHMLEVIRPLALQLREEVIAFCLLDNFNRLGDQLSGLIQSSLTMVESPWIKTRLEQLSETNAGIFIGEGLQDVSGKMVNLSQLKGKTLLIHFWISGCKFCLYEYQNVMREISEKYADDPNIQIMTVNADVSVDNWKKSLSTGEYTSESSLNLWVPQGTGLLKTYSIHSFPQKMIIGPDGIVNLQSINKMELDDLANRLEAISNSSISTSFPPNP
ncbi:MAG: TlpA disulfide reductase family protein [Algoriphagus sp.]|uniref:TlpA family protein disulfide reductase n=1 Tax=Algoriphagus sp. TaxID=1872435 RepID=UPI002734FEC9|nr:TlpA disulfide reductase family protein [Algoriphagus sp.]MDP3198928.1 TlpA disulfide reductase family protein [Algoriphagus sp.]